MFLNHIYARRTRRLRILTRPYLTRPSILARILPNINQLYLYNYSGVGLISVRGGCNFSRRGFEDFLNHFFLLSAHMSIDRKSLRSGIVLWHGTTGGACPPIISSGGPVSQYFQSMKTIPYFSKAISLWHRLYIDN